MCVYFFQENAIANAPNVAESRVKMANGGNAAPVSSDALEKVKRMIRHRC